MGQYGKLSPRNGMKNLGWSVSFSCPAKHLYLRATSFSAKDSGTHSHLLCVVSVSMGCTLIITPHCVQGDLQGEEVSKLEAYDREGSQDREHRYEKFDGLTEKSTCS